MAWVVHACQIHKVAGCPDMARVTEAPVHITYQQSLNFHVNLLSQTAPVKEVSYSMTMQK